jgi:hypothetical protein
MQGFANPCIFTTNSSFLNAYELQMDHFWCHWKKYEISYKLGTNNFEKGKKLHPKIAIESLQPTSSCFIH